VKRVISQGGPPAGVEYRIPGKGWKKGVIGMKLTSKTGDLWIV